MSTILPLVPLKATASAFWRKRQRENHTRIGTSSKVHVVKGKCAWHDPEASRLFGHSQQDDGTAIQKRSECDPVALEWEGWHQLHHQLENQVIALRCKHLFLHALWSPNAWVQSQFCLLLLELDESTFPPHSDCQHMEPRSPRHHWGQDLGYWKLLTIR